MLRYVIGFAEMPLYAIAIVAAAIISMIADGYDSAITLSAPRYAFDYHYAAMLSPPIDYA